MSKAVAREEANVMVADSGGSRTGVLHHDPKRAQPYKVRRTATGLPCSRLSRYANMP